MLVFECMYACCLSVSLCLSCSLFVFLSLFLLLFLLLCNLDSGYLCVVVSCCRYLSFCFFVIMVLMVIAIVILMISDDSDEDEEDKDNSDGNRDNDRDYVLIAVLVVSFSSYLFLSCLKLSGKNFPFAIAILVYSHLVMINVCYMIKLVVVGVLKKCVCLFWHHSSSLGA